MIKTPKENREHKLFLEAADGFDFFRSANDRFHEFGPGEPQFDDEVDRLAQRLRDVLCEMRNQRQAIYVAEPPPELESIWLTVRTELSGRGYSVLPVNRLDAFFAEKALLTELKPAILSVHLLGGSYHEFSARQAHLARELQKSVVVWVAPDLPRDTRQLEFLDKDAGFRTSKARYVFLENTRDWELIDVIFEELKPKRELPARSNNGPASIYLICDRNDPGETDLAAHLRQSIIDHEKMNVLLPGIDKDPKLRDQEHLDNLSSCDGVLLYWGRAGKEWFYENYGDVNAAPRRHRNAKPFRSEAIVLGKPDDLSKSQVDGRLVIRDFDEPRLDRLEPFLAPLRAGTGMLPAS